MHSSTWKESFTAEIENALQARADGKEGQARVCARRAAGIAINEYMQRKSLPIPGPSAYERLVYLKNDPNSSPDVIELADHLILRVNTDFNLPSEVDLISDARHLAVLLGLDVI